MSVRDSYDKQDKCQKINDASKGYRKIRLDLILRKKSKDAIDVDSKFKSVNFCLIKLIKHAVTEKSVISTDISVVLISKSVKSSDRISHLKLLVFSQ